MWQSVVVAGLVAACSVYVLWSLLLSAALRRRLLERALRLPMPARLKHAAQQQRATANACGCDGCDRSAVKPAVAGEQAVRFVRRAGR